MQILGGRRKGGVGEVVFVTKEEWVGERSEGREGKVGWLL